MCYETNFPRHAVTLAKSMVSPLFAHNTIPQNEELDHTNNTQTHLQPSIRVLAARVVFWRVSRAISLRDANSANHVHNCAQVPARGCNGRDFRNRCWSRDGQISKLVARGEPSNQIPAGRSSQSRCVARCPAAEQHQRPRPTKTLKHIVFSITFRHPRSYPKFSPSMSKFRSSRTFGSASRLS